MASALALRVAAACVLAAGIIAFVAVATGSFDRTDGKLVATSVAFGVFSAFAASGTALAGRAGGAWRFPVGATGVLASIAAFVLLLAALWLPEADTGDTIWRAWGIASLVALWCWHAGVILGPLRDDDQGAVVAASAVAVGALGLDTLGTVATLAGWLDRHPDPARVQAFAAVLVAAIVASVMVPILRRLQPSRRPAPPRAAVAPPANLPAAVAPAAPVPAPRRGPAQTLRASWHDGDQLTRTGLVMLAAAPLLAGLALAVALPARHSPGATSTVTVAMPPATVTQVPPEPAAGTAPGDFTAADGARIIARRRLQFDRQATRQALRLAPIVERCFAQSEDFTACDTPAELPAAAAARLSLGMGQAQVAVVASSVTTYAIDAHSRTGTTFTLTRDATGAQRRRCAPLGAGGCSSDGTW